MNARMLADNRLDQVEYMDKTGYQGEQPRVRSRRRLYIIVAAVIAVLALAIGLGVGLALRNKRNGSDGSSDGSTPPSSTPTGTVTNRSFWQPQAGASWQIVLLNPITVDPAATTATPNVDAYDIDMFTTSQDTINKLHALDKKIICYFSAGSYESYRPDSSNFTAADQGGELDGWPGEKWLKLSSTNVRNIMASRIKYASDKGCDAIDPDNVDGFSNKENGLGLTQQDSIDFVKFLSTEASKYNMSTGLKNAAAIIPSVLNYTHFSVNEQCVQYGECASFNPFIKANKPVFHIEYPDGAPSVSATTRSGICSATGQAAGADDFSTVIKKMNLDGWVEYCDGTTATTSTTSGNSSKVHAD